MTNFQKISSAVILLLAVFLCLGSFVSSKPVEPRGIYCLAVGAPCSEDAEKARNKGKRIYCLGEDFICTKPISNGIRLPQDVGP